MLCPADHHNLLILRRWKKPAVLRPSFAINTFPDLSRRRPKGSINSSGKKASVAWRDWNYSLEQFHYVPMGCFFFCYRDFWIFCVFLEARYWRSLVYPMSYIWWNNRWSRAEELHSCFGNNSTCLYGGKANGLLTNTKNWSHPKIRSNKPDSMAATSFTDLETPQFSPLSRKGKRHLRYDVPEKLRQPQKENSSSPIASLLVSS